MARGWESKSVESQQEEAVRPAPAAPDGPQAGTGAEQISQRRTLELARARAVADLNSATHPAHRAMLEQVIAALDRRIGDAARVAE